MTQGSGPIQVDVSLCQGCGECVAACTERALCVEAGRVWVDGSRCTGCGVCIAICPNAALYAVSELTSTGEALVVPVPKPVVVASVQAPMISSQLTKLRWPALLASTARVVLPRLLDLWLAPTSKSETPPATRAQADSLAAEAEDGTRALLGRRHRHRSGRERGRWS